VAIKVISPSLGASPALVERFRREARTAASLSHPNIIPIYSVRHADRLLYFVMKHVDGRPLDSILRETGALPLPTVQAILGQVAGAVGYAHRHGVVHRDIKPGNILIDDEGWCVVTDFGIAKVAESEGLTTSGMMVGTPAYHESGAVPVERHQRRLDQYALGVVAYEMLTGRLPFPGTSMMSVMYAHVHVPVPAIEDLRSECPPELASAVMRMLAKNRPSAGRPSRRPWRRLVSFGGAGRAHAQPAHHARHHGLAAAQRALYHAAEPHSVSPREPWLFRGEDGPDRSRQEPAWSRAAVIGAGILLAAAVYFAPWRRLTPEARPAPIDVAGQPPTAARSRAPPPQANRPSRPRPGHLRHRCFEAGSQGRHGGSPGHDSSRGAARGARRSSRGRGGGRHGGARGGRGAQDCDLRQ